MSSISLICSFDCTHSVHSKLPVPILPTKKEAECIFWGLHDRFWKQIIDGKYHKYGPMVFDEALHGHDKEPGFFSSLKSGCEFASSHLTEELTVIFYKELHKNLCAHFQGKKNNVLIANEETGKFRNDSKKNIFSNLSLSYFLTKRAPSQAKIDETVILFNDHLTLEGKLLMEQKMLLNSDGIGQIVNRYHELWDEAKKKVMEINKYIMQFSNTFKIPSFAWISAWPDTGIKIEYRCSSSQDLETIVQSLFVNYQQKICELNSKLNNQNITSLESEINLLKLEKIEVIADLFQKLEWLHPFPDGQGRTDLVLLAKLLSEQGFNPPILEDPFFSTYSSPADWKEYLIESIQRWKTERMNSL